MAWEARSITGRTCEDGADTCGRTHDLALQALRQLWVILKVTDMRQQIVMTMTWISPSTMKRFVLARKAMAFMPWLLQQY